MTVTADSDRTGPYQQAASDPHWCDCRRATASATHWQWRHQRRNSAADSDTGRDSESDSARAGRFPAEQGTGTWKTDEWDASYYWPEALFQGRPVALLCTITGTGALASRSMLVSVTGRLSSPSDQAQHKRMSCRTYRRQLETSLEYTLPSCIQEHLPLSWGTAGKADRELHTCD